jgi:5-methylcytosine-specific restriction protein A
MNIPLLDKSNREREYKQYSDYEKSLICKGWLFEGDDHRDLDNKIVGLDPLSSKGFQSMAVLHFLGLKVEFKSIFQSISLNDAVANLKNNTQDFERVIELLNYKANFHNIIEEDYIRVKASQKDTPKARRKRLQKNIKITRKHRLYIDSYTRNPDVIAESLYLADGICQRCGREAPFTRKSDGSLYLEVHHIIPLSKQDLHEENLDVLDNVTAICPNCHREVHYG